jgi:hypothetical protein
MHNGRSRQGAGLRAAALVAHAAIVAACGYRSVEIPIEHCQLEQPPDCLCAGHLQTPLCVANTWSCPPCVAAPNAAGVFDAQPEKPSPSDATTARPDADGNTDAGAGDGDGDSDGGGCGDGAALICRWGCGDHVRERSPTCDGTTWRCRWGGALEERSTPPRPCDDNG